MRVRETLPIVLAGASFVLSMFTLWVTQFRHGQLKMTQPTLLCLKRDQPTGVPKLFLRTLLYTTASKGRVVESMFLRVHHPYGTYIFEFWGHTESGKLTLGSGLFVGSTGVAADHHFNPRHDANQFVFASGEYRVEIVAALVGHTVPKKLMELTFWVNGQQSAELIQIFDVQLFLFWNADKRSYDGQIHRGAGIPDPPLWGHSATDNPSVPTEASLDHFR